MELYIRIVDGQPFEHPIFGDNFRQAFPHIDTNNLPSEFARFERTPPPKVGVYEVEVSTYQWDNGVVKDVWSARPMTTEEKAEKIASYKSGPHPDGWLFNEEQCRWEPDLSASGAAPNVID